MNGPDLYRIKDAALIFPSQLLCKYYVNIIDKRPTANDNSTIQTSTLDTMKNGYDAVENSCPDEETALTCNYPLKFRAFA